MDHVPGPAAGLELTSIRQASAINTGGVDSPGGRARRTESTSTAHGAPARIDLDSAAALSTGGRRARPVCRIVYLGPGPRLFRLDVSAAGALDRRAQLRALYRSARAVADLVAAGHLDRHGAAAMLAHGTVAAGWHRLPGIAPVLAAGLSRPRRAARSAG